MCARAFKLCKHAATTCLHKSKVSLCVFQQTNWSFLCKSWKSNNLHRNWFLCTLQTTSQWMRFSDWWICQRAKRSVQFHKMVFVVVGCFIYLIWIGHRSISWLGKLLDSISGAITSKSNCMGGLGQCLRNFLSKIKPRSHFKRSNADDWFAAKIVRLAPRWCSPAPDQTTDQTTFFAPNSMKITSKLQINMGKKIV